MYKVTFERRIPASEEWEQDEWLLSEAQMEVQKKRFRVRIEIGTVRNVVIVKV